MAKRLKGTTSERAETSSGTRPPLRVAGLFAGIGGIELGLHASGHTTSLLCEIDETANAVLTERFPGVRLERDVRKIEALPEVDLVVAGFPCQDLSQAGKTAGIRGNNSGLVGEVFRLIQGMKKEPRWLLLENVPFMLQLDRGHAMTFLTHSLEKMGFKWAYRTVDTQSFGLPQRRHRVLVLASRTDDPRTILFPDDAGPGLTVEKNSGEACGFYWTEGTRGLGWAVDAVPTLKGGSTVGIPSPPAIWLKRGDGSIVTPDIRDAERLQGFPEDWTTPAATISKKKGARWKLVGNAVSVPVAEWVGRCLRNPRRYEGTGDEKLTKCPPWPSAAWGRDGEVFRAHVSLWPVRKPYQHLADFLRYEPKPLSQRATGGFLSRARSSSLRFPDGFLDAVAQHLERMTNGVVAE